MKNFCNRMVWVLYLAVLSSFAYATKNYTAKNATAVVQFVAVAANITVKNTTNNTTVSPPYSTKFHKTKARAWLQNRVNGTLPNATKLVAQGRNATSGYQGQPSGAGKKGGRNKSTGRRGRTETPEPASKTEGSRKTVVEECFIAKPLSGKQDKESYRPNSRDARRGYADGNSVTRGDSGNGQAKESDISIKKAGYPIAKSLLPARLPILQRNTPELPPPPPEPVPVGNANFTSILGQSHDGHFHLVEPVNLNNQHAPLHNATEPFSGELDCRGHAISGLNKPLFGAIDGSHLDLVLDTPNVTGNPAGAVASQMGSNNDVKVKVIDGSVTCNGTDNCHVGLIGGEVQGNYNYIEQYDSTGQVRATETLNDYFFDFGGRQIASLSLGSVKGDGNTLVQSNTSGSAIADALTGTFTNDTGGSPQTTNGTVVVAAAGPGYMAGNGNTVIQERVEANMTSIVAGVTNRITPGVVTGVQSLAGLGAGIVEGDQFTLGQTDVKGHIEARASGHSSILDSNCHYDDICPNDTYTDSIVREVQAVATVGVSEMKGDFPQVTQIDAEGQLEATVSNTDSINHYNPNNTVPAAAYRGAVVGRYDSVGGLLRLYSGNVGENVSVVGAQVGGEYSGGSLIDRPGYIAGSGVGSNIQELNTTQATPNFVVWESLCVHNDAYQCGNGRSCHYVHDDNPSLVSLPNGDLALLSQQSYPYGSEADNANGVFRVTQFKAANGTNGADSAGDAFPQLNENVGYFGTTVYETEVPQGKRLSLPVSQHANSTHIHNLYEQEEGIKIASFPITKTGNSEASATTTYHTVDFNVPGQPLLLSDNGFSVWMVNGTSTINRYHYDGLNQLNSKTSFHLESLHEGSSRVLAIGHNSDWLYVARYLDDNQIMIVRSSLVNRLPDPNFMLTLNTPGTGIDYQLIVDEHHNVLLLPRGTVHMALEPDNGNTNGPGTSYRDNDGNIITALKADLPGTGGCMNWKIVQAQSIQATAPPHVTAVVPNPSSRTLLSTVNQMTTKMSSLAVTSTPLQAQGAGGDADSGVSIVEIAVPVATGITLVGVGTAAGVYCTFKMIKRKRKLADSEAISLGVISKNEGATDTDV